MFNKLNKLIAYILIMSLLISTCSATAMATGTSEEQSAPTEAVQEESHESSVFGGGSENGDSGEKSNDNNSEKGSDDGVDSNWQDASPDGSDSSAEGERDESDGGDNSESSVDDESSLNEEDGNRPGDNAAGTSTNSSGWYDSNGNWHSNDVADNSGNGHTDGYTGDGYDYADDSEPNQDGTDPDNQDQDTSNQGTAGSTKDQAQQGQTNAGTGPQNNPTDPAVPQDPADPTEPPLEKRPQTVVGKPSYDKHLGDDFFRLDVSTDGDGPLIFWSSNESVIDMSHTGRAYIKGTGTAVIGIQAEETDRCKKSNVMRVTITVRKREQKINAPVYYTKSVETEPFKIDLTKTGNGPVIYESSNKNVATVSKTGKVTIKSVGSAKITVYAAETATCMKSAAQTIHVNVGPKKTELTGNISIENNKAMVEWQQQNDVSGYLVQYSTQRDFSDGKVVRASSTSKSAEINGLEDDAYYVRVRSYKKQGEKNLYSEWSATEAFGGKIATPATEVIIGRNSRGSRVRSATETASGTVVGSASGTASGSASGTAAIVRNSGSAGISGRIVNAGAGAADIGEEIGHAGTGEGQGSAPMFSTIVTNLYWAVAKHFQCESRTEEAL